MSTEYIIETKFSFYDDNKPYGTLDFYYTDKEAKLAYETACKIAKEVSRNKYALVAMVFKTQNVDGFNRYTQKSIFKNGKEVGWEEPIWMINPEIEKSIPLKIDDLANDEETMEYLRNEFPKQVREYFKECEAKQIKWHFGKETKSNE